MRVLTTISGIVPVRRIGKSYDTFEIEADYDFRALGDKDRLVRADIGIYNANRKLIESLRVASKIRVTVEVLSEHNDTGET